MEAGFVADLGDLRREMEAKQKLAQQLKTQLDAERKQTAAAPAPGSGSSKESGSSSMVVQALEEEAVHLREENLKLMRSCEM